MSGPVHSLYPNDVVPWNVILCGSLSLLLVLVFGWSYMGAVLKSGQIKRLASRHSNPVQDNIGA